MFNALDKNLLREIADLDGLPQGAYSIRKNGKVVSRASTVNITIEPNDKEDGITVTIAPGTVDESVHIPVILNESGLNDVVYNTFIVGENANVTIIAGCGIQCGGPESQAHVGVHEFRINKGARVRYVEKHYAGGLGSGMRTMNPTTKAFLDENAQAEMELTQIGGVDEANRVNEAHLGAGSSLVVTERVMTDGNQKATSRNTIILDGSDSRSNMVSRSVIKGNSQQDFYATMVAKAKSFGHIECDAIIMENGRNETMPALRAEHPDAELSHEASIGKIAGDQLMKLMSMGMTYEESVNMIIQGFLR
jgi:uncharacterized protein